MLFLAYSFLLLAFLLFMMNVTDRFLKYVGYGTQSDPNTGLNPSTPGQMEFAHVLKEEMEAIGIQEVELDEYGYVMGVIPSTVERETPAIGFIAHMDTSPEMSGRHVNPRIIENYAGNDIVLNKEKGIVLSTEEFPELMNYVGQTLITTDGNTLLGADDKAGIAEILTAAEYLIGHPEVKHGKICICFTPDEEIGEGPDHFNVKKFGAKFAYTMDGGEIGELEFENFNAANARIVFKGRNIHPGYAKNKMVNSIAVANEFMASLPKKEVPENTSGYEGFFHVYSIKGDVETTEIEILIRDFDRERFEWRKNTIENGVREFSKRFGLKIELELKDRIAICVKRSNGSLHYRYCKASHAGVEYQAVDRADPGRYGWGTVVVYGVTYSESFYGGHNFHGRYEYIPVYAMEKAVQLIIRIAELCTKI